MNYQTQLIQRMIRHVPGQYSGGYCTLGLDDALVADALAEANAQHPEHPSEAVSLMCYLASQEVATRAEYDACRAFIADYVEARWSVNFGETDSAPAIAVYEAVAWS